MKRRFAAAALGILAVTLSACRGAVSDEYVREDEAYSLDEIAGSDVLKVTLSASAVEHIGIETTTVGTSGAELIVPNDAVYIDAHGGFWVYTNPEPLVFIRAPIDITRETSTQAFLADGPPAGTQVVTVGVPQLYGAEHEFGT